MIAFPCGPWGPLLRLNPRVNLHEIQAEGEVLLKFALELAAIQADGGGHNLLENPQPSGAWKHPEMAKFLDEHDHRLACFHQCRFGLRGNIGLHCLVQLDCKPTFGWKVLHWRSCSPAGDWWEICHSPGWALSSPIGETFG